MENTWYKELVAAGIPIQTDVQLASKCSFRIGGPADLVLYPQDVEQFIKSVSLLRSYCCRHIILGNATNILFDDAGYRGAVLFTGGIKGIIQKSSGIYALCGDSLNSIAVAARDACFSGLEFAYGIPGTCGGAVYMNAGAYGGQISDVLYSCEVYDGRTGDILALSNDMLCFSYRHSLIADNNDFYVLSATFALEPDEKLRIADTMSDYMSRRRVKQPLEYPSAGSVFKRPAPDVYVGKLIEDAGLKGCTDGGAAVSEKHAGFIVNKGGATSEDVIRLVEHVKNTILIKYGIDLACEIQYIPEK